MERYKMVEVKLRTFLTLVLNGASRSVRFVRAKLTGSEGPRGGLDMVAKRKVIDLARNRTPVTQPVARLN
jgi:hypothetical protein